MSNRRTDLVGSLFVNRFAIQKGVGNGRMSSVYLALDQDDGNRQVAVKLLDTEHPDEIRREAFRRETQALRRLRHPNVVEMLGGAWSESEGAFYLVLDYSPYSLDSVMRGESGAALVGFDKYRVIRQLADALACAHSERVVHRDIKTANILLDESGEPKLADFGVSKLLGHLTVGQTLAPFWSAGFASPEQRGGGAVGQESDIYSLGAVFFHMLTGEEPQPEGPSALALYRNGNVEAPQPLVDIVADMLEDAPNKRPPAADVLARLTEITRRSESLPTHSLILTDTAIGHLAETGHIPSFDRDSAAEAVVRDLGGDESNEVSVHQIPRDDQIIIILGDSLRLFCKPSDERNALVVINVRAPYGASHQTEKSYSLPIRAMWRVVNHRGWRPDSAAADGLANLIAQAGHSDTVENVSRRQRQSRQEFIERWRQTLGQSQDRIESQSPRLRYSSVDEDDGFITFTLSGPPPDDLAFEDDQPLAVFGSDGSFRIPVGSFVSARGREIQVDGDSASIQATAAIPQTGTLTTDVAQASASIQRRRRAVDSFLHDTMANSKLGAAIVNPSRATRKPENGLDFFQEWLSEDKKDAVRRAVSSNELFLIQGPPGTGKTAVIAEIILQILKANPDARILLSSQSNVAVDHALTRVSEAAGDSAPEMVRLGRSDKIGHGGEQWTLEARARAWRQDVLANLTPADAELKAAERAARDAVRQSGFNLNSPRSRTMDERIRQAREIADSVADSKRELEGLEKDFPNRASAQKSELSAAIQDGSEQLRDRLDSINAALAQPIDPSGMSDGELMSAIVDLRLSQDGGESETEAPEIRELQRIQDIRQAIADWRKVVGVAPDFQELIGKSSRVVAGTCLYIGGRGGDVHGDDVPFDWTVIDEAGRATAPEILIPISKAERAVLVGDERQLPPMLDETMDRAAEDASEGDSLETSLFQTLIEHSDEPNPEYAAMLKTQYRMAPEIGSLVSAVFYEGKLENGERAAGGEFAWMPKPITWFSTSSLPDRREARRGQSFENRAEAEVILQLLQKLAAKLPPNGKTLSVGVITGYSAQVDLLIRRVDPRSRSKWPRLDIDVATVDSFQGRECDVVIYSTVRSNRRRTIGFLKDYRRINVALSRAQDLLLIVGDHAMMESATLERSRNPFAAVLEHIRSRPAECAIEPSENARLL